MPDLTTISGVLYDASGDVKAGARLTVRRVVKDGVLVSDRPVDYKSGADGSIEFEVHRNSIAYIDAPVVGLNTKPSIGVALTVPDAAMADLEDLVPATPTGIPGVSQATFNAHTQQKASADVLGHVRVGAGLSIDGDGVLSSSVIVTSETVQDALATFFPDSAPFDWTYDDDNNRVQLDIAAATTGQKGLMSAADKSKLDGVASGATANATDAQLRDRATHTGTQTLATISDAGTAASRNVPASGDAAAGEVVKGDDTRLSDSRTPSGGAGGVLSGTFPSPGFAVDMATQAELDSEAAARIAGDAAKQDANADLTAIAALAPSNDDVLQRKAGAWTNRTPAQLKTDLGLTKADVGLSSVDNTSDAAKPVSSAQQDALDSKQDAHNLLNALTEMASNGLVARTGSGTVSPRTLVAGSAKIAVTNGDGGAGNPSVDLGTVGPSDVGLGNVDNTSDATKNAATATLTNKTIALGSNTVSGTLAQFDAAVTDADLARRDAAQTLTGNQTISGNVLANTEGTNTIGNSGSNRFIMYPYALSVGTTTNGPGEARFGGTTNMTRISSGNLQAGSGVHLGWSGGDPSAVATDVGLARVSAGILRLSNGSTGYGKLATAASVTWSSGSGSPEGVVTAAVGSLYTRTDGGAATTLYVKESGAGNTGWVAK